MTIISGHQRLKASRDIGIKTVPVIIREELEDEDEKVKLLLAANFGRLKNNPIKQSKVISEYERLCGVRQGSAGKRSLGRQNVVPNQEEIALQFGVDVRTIQRIKKLQDLIPELQDLVETGNLSASAASGVVTGLSKDFVNPRRDNNMI
jgi:ParB family chromosome partitioning protein